MVQQRELSSEAQRPFEIGSVWALGLKAPVCVCIRDAWVGIQKIQAGLMN